MSLLASVTTGKQIGPQIHVIYGNNGVGKTTFAAAFPKALIIDLENGSNHLDVARVASDKIKTLGDLNSLLKELCESAHTFRTIVIDSVESLEHLIFDAVCAEGKVDSIEKYEGGYGKGYMRSREIMRELFNPLRLLQLKGVSTILVAHSQVRQMTDPATNQVYDRVIMRANDKLAAVIRDLADNVFYATHKTFTTVEKGKTKAFSDGQRVMLTQWRAGFDAKNRLELPHELPLSYEAFQEACQTKPEANVDDLLKDIDAMSKSAKPDLQAIVKTQVEKFKTNPVKLKELKNRLMKHVSA